MSKKLSVYLYSTEEADSVDATLLRLYDCGNSGERYEEALKMLDGDEEAIRQFRDSIESDGEQEDVEFESYQIGPGAVQRGLKIDINVRDEEKDKDVHTSTFSFKDDAAVLFDQIDNLAFAEDFPPLLKEHILDVIAKLKATNLNPSSLRYGIAKCATYYPLNQYRKDHPQVTDDNIYIGVGRQLSMDNVCFEIEIDEKEKFDKKKLFLFGFEWIFRGLYPMHEYLTCRNMCPLLLYGNTLYYGHLGDWSYEGELYGILKFAENPEEHSFKMARAGFGKPLAEGKKNFVAEQ